MLINDLNIIQLMVKKRLYFVDIKIQYSHILESKSTFWKLKNMKIKLEEINEEKSNKVR